MEASLANMYGQQNLDYLAFDDQLSPADSLFENCLDLVSPDGSMSSAFSSYFGPSHASSVECRPPDACQDQMTAKGDGAHSNDTEGPSQKGSKPPPKRKRENRYKNASPSVLSRRRAQNRASQQAYRERKDQRIRELEGLLEQARQQNDTLALMCSNLQAELLMARSAGCSPSLQFDDFTIDEELGIFLQGSAGTGQLTRW